MNSAAQAPQRALPKAPRQALTDSGLPYGLPDFRLLASADYEPLIEAGLAEYRAEINKVVANPEPPTLANTLSALETSGQLFARAMAAFHNLVWSNATSEIEAANARIAPKVANFRSEMLTNVALYERLLALANSIGGPDDAQYLLERRLAEMRRAGVALTGKDREKLHQLDQRIAELEAQFGRQLLAASNAGAILITDETELAGLSDDAKATLAAAATAHDQTGWLIRLELSTHQPIIKSLQNRDLRRRIQAASEARGREGETSTLATISELARLRAERAQLLGFENHAAYVASGSVSKTTARIDELLEQVDAPAIRSAERERTKLTAALRQDLQDPTAELQASDWQHYAEQLHKAELDWHEAELRPYLEFNRVLQDGVFYAANKLYGLRFSPRPDLSGYHPDVVVYEVFPEVVSAGSTDDGGPNAGAGLGLILYDPYTRPTKRGGAWMNALIPQSHLLGNKPVVVQNLNIAKPAPGQPTLLTWSQVTTMFHEFGHALHGLLSDVYYPTQSGTAVPRDFVEYPSQVNEMWALDPQVISNYAKHHQTGQTIPDSLVAKLKDAAPYGEIFGTAEMAGAVALDQAWHRLKPDQVPPPEGIAQFEQHALQAAGLDYPPIPPRYRTSYYNHIWTSGYSAAYYAYLYSEMFDADTEQWYHENGGLSRENGERFRRAVLARGMTRDPVESFEALRGRPVNVEPLLKRRGLN